MQEGAKLIQQIALYFCNFYSLDESEVKKVNIDESIHSSLFPLQNRVAFPTLFTDKFSQILCRFTFSIMLCQTIKSDFCIS